MSTIEESVIALIRQRAETGEAKYGVTMQRTDLSRAEWLRHAQAEALDLAVYLEKLIREEEQERQWNPNLTGERHDKEQYGLCRKRCSQLIPPKKGMPAQCYGDNAIIPLWTVANSKGEWCSFKNPTCRYIVNNTKGGTKGE